MLKREGRLFRKLILDKLTGRENGSDRINGARFGSDQDGREHVPAEIRVTVPGLTRFTSLKRLSFIYAKDHTHTRESMRPQSQRQSVLLVH